MKALKLPNLLSHEHQKIAPGAELGPREALFPKQERLTLTGMMPASRPSSTGYSETKKLVLRKLNLRADSSSPHSQVSESPAY